MCNTTTRIYALLPVFRAYTSIRKRTCIFISSHAYSCISSHKNACIYLPCISQNSCLTPFKKGRVSDSLNYAHFYYSLTLLSVLKAKHLEDPAINHMYVCIQSYLDGQSSSDEVVGIMRGSDLPAGKLAGIMRQLSDYGDRDRYSLLYRECKLFGMYWCLQVCF